MWIGTSNGISSYDGYQIKSFNISSHRSENVINDIAQTSDGVIWAAAKSGVYMVDGTQRWLSKSLPEIRCNVSVIKVHDNRMYCGTDEGLYICSIMNDKKVIRHIWLTKNHLEGINKVNDMVLDNDKIWLLGNTELYVYDLHTSTIRNVHLRGRVQLSNAFRKLVKYGNRLFIGTYNDGLLVYDIANNLLTPFVDVKCRVITCLSVSNGLLYVGTDGSGLQVISLKNNRILQVFSTAANSVYPLKDNTVYAYYQHNGVMFFGYYRQGLQHNYAQKTLFKAYTLPGVFSSLGKNIRSICIDGHVKILGLRGGLWYIDELRNLIKFFKPEELGGSIVTNVVKYAGMYYCSTFNGGVMRINPQTLDISRFGRSEALRTSSFGCLRVSPDNELWMSGNAGVYIYNALTNSERHYDFRNSQLPDGYCNNILFDRQDRCWISTAKGICIYDPVRKTIYDRGFPTGFFNMQSETSGVLGDGDNLLFWSRDGLFRTNEEMTDFMEIRLETPIAREYISQIVYDRRHKNYWVATETGMFRYDKALKSFMKFSDASGLLSRAFSNNAIAVTDGNRLWTGTMDGLYTCNLDEAAHYDQGKIRILLDNMFLGRDAADDGKIVDMLRFNVVRMVYHWGAQTLHFTPVALDYSKQEYACYEYRIDGGEWKQHNGQSEITIAGLPLGHTVMEIRMAGSKYATYYDIYVYPSGWFIFEIVGIVTFFFVVILLYRQRRVVRLQKEAMARVQQELDETKRKYSRVSTNEDEQQRLFKRLETYMRTDKPFLNSELKLSDIASHLEVSTVKLSQLFSMYIKKNYYDYVNQWRLEEFKSRLNDKRYARFTLLALAEECGFKRSSFFSTFKKVEGVTPTEYVKRSGV